MLKSRATAGVGDGHFDLRLERGGVLVSWAVPKGMPTEPTADRLAVAVADHSLDHLDVEDLRPVDGGATVDEQEPRDAVRS